MEVKYSIYDILKIDEKQYRILSIQPIYTSVIELDVNKINILAIENSFLSEQIESGHCIVKQEASDSVLDSSTLPKRALEDLRRKKSLLFTEITEV